MTGTAAVRVVIADDHPMFRYGVAAVLASAPEIELVGEAADGGELLALVEREQPDVVLTDLAMPGMDGAAACRRLAASRPDLGVLVLTMHADEDSILAAMRAGARGYVLKGADKAELVRSILAVADGQAVYGAPVAQRIATIFRDGGQTAQPTEPFPELTARERQVLTLLAEGARNSEIARQLGMSEKTVRNHVSAILSKLGVPDRTAAAIKASETWRRSGPQATA